MGEGVGRARRGCHTRAFASSREYKINRETWMRRAGDGFSLPFKLFPHLFIVSPLLTFPPSTPLSVSSPYTFLLSFCSSCSSDLLFSYSFLSLPFGSFFSLPFFFSIYIFLFSTFLLFPSFINTFLCSIYSYPPLTLFYQTPLVSFNFTHSSFASSSSRPYFYFISTAERKGCGGRV